MLLSSTHRLVFIKDHVLSLLIPFQPEWLHVLPWCWSTSFMSFNPQSSRNVPCSSHVTECSQLHSSPPYSFLEIVLPLKVRGFTRLSKKQLCFTSFPLLSGAIPRISGRDPLLVWESCDAPRPTLQKTSSYSEFRRVIYFVCYFHHRIFRIASCHHAIMPFNFKT